jgi:hypothetical protein
MERFDGEESRDGFANQFGRQINDFFTNHAILNWENPTPAKQPDGEVSDFDY